MSPGSSPRARCWALRCAAVLSAFTLAASSNAQEPAKPTGNSHYLRAACLAGWVLQTNGLLRGDNLDLKIDDDDLRAQYGNQSYAIVSLTAVVGRRFSYRSRVVAGLDFAYDESVEDIARVDAFNEGTTSDYESSDSYFVRFHELGDADNLEWNLGYRIPL